MSYKNRVVVVTGSGEGVGRSIALKYAKKGAIVVVADKSDSLGRETVDMIYDIKGSGIFITCDVTDEESVMELFRKLMTYYGRVDILINNVGMSFSKAIDMTTLDEWQKVIDSNLKSLFLCIREVTPIMKQARHGFIVNIACSDTLFRGIDMEIYSAAMGGVISLTKSLAVSLESFGIQVNSVSPGFLKPSGYKRLKTVVGEEPISFGFSRMNDVAEACIALTHEDNDCVNGTDVVIDQARMKKMVHLL